MADPNLRVSLLQDIMNTAKAFIDARAAYDIEYAKSGWSDHDPVYAAASRYKRALEEYEKFKKMIEIQNGPFCLIFKILNREDCKVEILTLQTRVECENIIKLWQSGGNEVPHRIMSKAELELLMFGELSPANTNGAI